MCKIPCYFHEWLRADEFDEEMTNAQLSEKRVLIPDLPAWNNYLSVTLSVLFTQFPD